MKKIQNRSPSSACEVRMKALHRSKLQIARNAHAYLRQRNYFMRPDWCRTNCIRLVEFAADTLILKSCPSPSNNGEIQFFSLFIIIIYGWMCAKLISIIEYLLFCLSTSFDRLKVVNDTENWKWSFSVTESYWNWSESSRYWKFDLIRNQNVLSKCEYFVLFRMSKTDALI